MNEGDQLPTSDYEHMTLLNQTTRSDYDFQYLSSESYATQACSYSDQWGLTWTGTESPHFSTSESLAPTTDNTASSLFNWDNNQLLTAQNCQDVFDPIGMTTEPGSIPDPSQSMRVPSTALASATTTMSSFQYEHKFHVDDLAERPSSLSRVYVRDKRRKVHSVRNSACDQCIRGRSRCRSSSGEAHSKKEESWSQVCQRCTQYGLTCTHAMGGKRSKTVSEVKKSLPEHIVNYGCRTCVKKNSIVSTNEPEQPESSTTMTSETGEEGQTIQGRRQVSRLLADDPGEVVSNQYF